MKFSAVFTIILFLQISFTNGANPTTKHYIVYMGEHSHPNSDSVISANHDMLAAITGSIDGEKKAAVHHYCKSFRGFSAMLTTEQAQRLAESESVISVFESRTAHLHTTHSWDFLGVDYLKPYNDLPIKAKSDVIIGVIDTGVWPEAESFDDKGLGPVPERFKGECVTGELFTLANCNSLRRLILTTFAVRYYYKGFEAEKGLLKSFNTTFFLSARDSEGHGTYASIVAGSAVKNASVLRIAQGTARGGVPSARLAIYKVCWFGDCSEADVLSALDDATRDGVDVVSLSLGLPKQPIFFSSRIAIGTFHAFRKGVVVSAAGGNGIPESATNVLPWVITVAASTIDRDFETNLHLENSIVLKGRSLSPLKMKKYHEIVYASEAAAPGVPSKNASLCNNNTLDRTMIQGKIVVCTVKTELDIGTDKSIFVRDAGGIGLILIVPSVIDLRFQYVIPSTVISQNEAKALQAYVTKAKYPAGMIYPTRTILKGNRAPEIGVFSSKGPNVINPDIIKPDITAPGVNILGAWSPIPSVQTGGQSLDYLITSGTSASCPHVSAVAAIIKSCHPSWSPSAIKSAIMTTATVLDDTGSPIKKNPTGSQATPFDYGSGHVNPSAALDPGLVYDFNSNDIIDFLCSNGASPEEFLNLTGKAIECKNSSTPSYNLNYPSIGVSNMNGSLSVHRTVTYYGDGPTLYTAHLENPAGVKVSVTPYELKFNDSGEKKSYRVDFMPYKTSNGSFVFGSITWRNGVHRVTSPIGLNVISV